MGVFYFSATPTQRDKNMADETDGTATQTAKEEETVDNEPVKNAEAVLAKNKELLGKLAAEKAEREAALARIAEFEAKESKVEQARLEKKGEWEKLRDTQTAEHKKEIEAKDARYSALFENSSRFELAVELSKHETLEGTSERLAKLLLLDEIKPVEEKGKVVWRRKDTDEEVKLNEFIPSIKDAYGEFFKADNNPGGDAPGNKGRTTAGLKRSAMSRKEKSDYIGAHGLAKYESLPL